MLNSLVAFLIATSSTIASFPVEMRGSWGDEITDCEPEFVRGQTIEARSIYYYEGSDRLMALTPMKAVQTPFGSGRTMIAKLKYSFHDENSKSVERFTVVGKWLYRSKSQLTVSKHFSSKHRFVRCPSGSTGRIP